jgi:hypothetical protein
VDARSRVEAADLAHEKQDAGKKGVTTATNSFYTEVVGERLGWRGSGRHVHVVKGRRAGGSGQRPQSERNGHGRHGDDPEMAGAAARMGAGESKERGD